MKMYCYIYFREFTHCMEMHRDAHALCLPPLIIYILYSLCKCMLIIYESLRINASMRPKLIENKYEYINHVFCEKKIVTSIWLAHCL